MSNIATSCEPPLQASTSKGFYEYDDTGRLVKFTDRRGVVTRYNYDSSGRRNFVGFGEQGSPPTATYESTISYPEPTFQTNAQGQVERTEPFVDSWSGTITRAYDQLGRLVAEVTSQGSVSYGYDKLGRSQSMTVAGQPMVSYAYDTASRLTQITQGSTVVGFGYDHAGRRTSLTLPNTVTVTYTYDNASQLQEIVYKRGQTTLGSLVYEYDANGSRTKIGGSWARTGLPDPLTSATYNAANQQTAFAGQTLTYDLNGNLTNDGSRTYTWDARNQLVSITSGSTAIASFQFDAFGRRISKTITGTTTAFLYDGSNAVQELSGTTPTASLLTGGVDENFLRSDASGSSTFLVDALGSTVALLDAAGTTSIQYTYQPFGSTTASGTAANAFQFTGRENDGTGLYYYRARYYHPTLQRFISEDPIDFLGGDVDLYAYVSNNPVRYQ